MAPSDRQALKARSRRAPGAASCDFAAPYRPSLIAFLAVIIADALIGVATPVLAGRVVNDIPAAVAVHAVVWIAVAIAGPCRHRRRAVVRAALVLRAHR